MNGLPFVPAVEEMLMMLPLACSIICLPAAMQQRNVPVRLKSIRRTHSSLGASSSGWRIRAPPPALFTMTSSRPNSVTVRATNSSTCSGTVMSVATASARPPEPVIFATTPSMRS